MFLSIEVFVTVYVVNSAKYFVKGYIIKTLILFVKIDPRHMNIQRPFAQSSGIFVKSVP